MRSLHRALHISWHDDKAAPNRQFEQYNMVGGFGRHGAIDSWGFVISRSQNTIHIERQDAKGILPRWQPVCSVGRRMLKEIFGADDAVVFKSGGLDPEVGKQYRLMLQPIRDSQTVSKSEIDELSEMFLQISVSRWGHYKTVFQDRLRRLLHEDFSRAGFSPSLDVGAKITSNIRQIIEQCVRDWQQERQVPEMFPKP